MDGKKRKDGSSIGMAHAASLLDHVKARMSRFRPAELKVINLLLTEPDQFYNWTVTEVAERAATSEATVIRVAKLLGFHGFQALKIELAQERALVQRDMVEADANDDWTGATTKLEQHYHSMVHASVNIAQSAEFIAVLDAISAATHVITLGVGTSVLSAQILQYKFSRIGIHASHFTDGHFQSLAAAGMSPGEVAIAFSVSGSTRDTVDALALAKDAGATTVAVTHFMRSPIQRYADHVLLSQGFDSPIVSGSVITHVSQLVLIDALYLGLVLRDYDRVLARMEHSAQQLARFKKY